MAIRPLFVLECLALLAYPPRTERRTSDANRDIGFARNAFSTERRVAIPPGETLALSPLAIGDLLEFFVLRRGVEDNARDFRGEMPKRSLPVR